MKAGEHIDYEQTKDMVADLLAAINTLREKMRGVEEEKRDLQKAIDINVQTMQVLADRVRAEKAQVLEINEWKNAAEKERMAAEKRLHALEEAARDLLDSMLEVTADAMGILPERKRLAEVLERKCASCGKPFTKCDCSSGKAEKCTNS